MFFFFFSDQNEACTLTDILIFATGAARVPPLGFSPRPGIQFCLSKFPKANTCANILILPLEYYQNYEQFKESMIFGILNSPAFGYA